MRGRTRIGDGAIPGCGFDKGMILGKVPFSLPPVAECYGMVL